MRDLDQMSLKEKDKLLRGIIREYQKAQLQLKVINEKEFYPQFQYNVIKDKTATYNGLESSMINYIEKKENLETIVTFIDGILEALPKETYQLVESDYINPIDRNWWSEFYSRSTYYRIRKKALDDILFYLIK